LRSTRERRGTAEAFARAEGDLGVQFDAGKVNTTEGWRDVKVAVLTRREPGEPIAPSERDRRDLPAPSVRSVVAAVETATTFGERRAAEATRLSLTDPKWLDVLGDRAEWIWNLAEHRFPGASQCLDFWHGSGHLGGGAKAVFGSGVEAQAALDRGQEVETDGARGKVEHVAPQVQVGALAAGPEWETFGKQTGPDAKIERGNLRDRGPVVSGGGREPVLRLVRGGR